MPVSYCLFVGIYIRSMDSSNMNKKREKVGKLYDRSFLSPKNQELEACIFGPDKPKPSVMKKIKNDPERRTH